MQATIQLLINQLKTGGDYSTLELAACEVTSYTNYYQTMYSDESQYQFNWYRLLPGRAEREPLNTSHDGSFNGGEAQSERWEAWPNALDVSSLFLLNEGARRSGKSYTRCSFCAGLAYDFCDECSRAVCVMHMRQYDGYDRPLCPDHFDASLNEGKKRQRLAQGQQRLAQGHSLPFPENS